MRGYQKKVVFLKNTGSPVFEEAYFVLRSDGAGESKTTTDMVVEASRIIEENFEKKKRISLKSAGFYIISFLAGALISAVAVILIL